MRLLDLCAGIGGFSIAAHWLGWETVAFCERDKFCQKVLSKNFPGVEIHDDVYTFPSESFRGRVDVLTGGFPCQPFSAAGKRKGRDDERHLFPAILEIARIVRPAYCVFENVRGLLSIENGSVFAEIIASLEGIGYEVITFCLPASALDAPHRRDRLWIVARNTDGGRCKIGPKRNSEKVAGIKTPCWHDINRLNISTSNATSIGRRQGRPESAGFERVSASVCTDSDAPDARDEGLQGGESAERTRHARLGNRYGSDKTQGRYAPDTARFQPGRQEQRSERQRTGFLGWSENWPEVAARLCGMDAGLPDELDIVGSRDNRVNRLKALGNSIVPQIAYELFAAIEETENA